jgi:hypothetical protein
MPCTSLAPDFPIIPGKMRSSFYPTVWFCGKLPLDATRQPQLTENDCSVNLTYPTT